MTAILLVLKESYGYSAWAGMGADHAANGGIANVVHPFFPKRFAVLNVFEQQGVGKSGVTK